MPTIELILPIPVTLNKLYHNNSMKNGGGRSKTKRSKEWMRSAGVYAMPFIQDNRALCNNNITERNSHWCFKTKSHKLAPLHKDNPKLSYGVTYSYAFAQPRAVRPCDIANFEKQLSDFLVDIGMLLDDSFIDDMRLIRLPHNKDNPHVKIEIKILDQ